MEAAAPDTLGARKLAAIAPYQWKPGQSGNPRGTGPNNWTPETWIRHSFSAQCSEILKHHKPDLAATAPYKDLPVFQALIERTILYALAGDMSALKILLEQGFGLLPQKVQVQIDEEPWRARMMAMMQEPAAREHLLALAKLSVKPALPAPAQSGGNGHGGNGHHDGNGHSGNGSEPTPA